jgi:hypothetical protein
LLTLTAMQRPLATLAVLALCVAQPACLTATQWDPRPKTSTIAAIAVAEVGAAALAAASPDRDPNSDWNHTSYGLRTAEMFASFAAIDLLVFGLAHADLTQMTKD